MYFFMQFEKIEQCFDFIQSKEKPLAAYLFTKDKKLEEKFVKTVSAGGILINDTGLHVSSHILPLKSYSMLRLASDQLISKPN